MKVFCSICIEECDYNQDEINILNEKYTLKLLNQIVESGEDTTFMNNLIQNKFIKLDCSHMYHIACFLKSLEYNICYCNKCPMCRQFINMEFMVHLRNLYVKLLKKQIRILTKMSVKTKMKVLVYKALVYMKKENSNFEQVRCKLNDLIDIQKQYSLSKTDLESIVENLLVISHRPCRMAIDIYTRYGTLLRI